MNVTKTALQTEIAQLRALLAAEIDLRQRWESDARRAKRDIVKLRASAWRDVKATAPTGASRADMAREYCAMNNVSSVSSEQLNSFIAEHQ